MLGRNTYMYIPNTYRRIYSSEELHRSLRFFIELMEKNNIKPKDLGITTTYKYEIRLGIRKPSIELCTHLLRLIEGKRPDPSLGRLRGLSDLTASPNVAGLTSGFDMRPGVARPLWPGRAAVVL